MTELATTPRNFAHAFPGAFPGRLADWRLRLDALLHERLAAPFAWGTNDCAIFCADAVLALTGRDPLPAALRRHRSALQAQRALGRRGGLEQLVHATLGVPVDLAALMDGDVVLVDPARAGRDGARALGLWDYGLALGPGTTGLAALPAATVVHGWRIGHG